MAVRGQRFTLDPDADNFTFNLEANDPLEDHDDAVSFVKEIRERDPTGPPPPPKLKQTKTGFPQHRFRGTQSAFKLRQQQSQSSHVDTVKSVSSHREPSDRAIINHISQKHGIDPDAKEKAEISDENKRRIAQMSTEDIEEARAEIMSNMSPALIERLLKRANIDEHQTDEGWVQDLTSHSENDNNISDELSEKKVAFTPTQPDEEGVLDKEDRAVDPAAELKNSSPDNIEPQFHEVPPSIHFPVPPRNADDYVALNPDSPSFLADLKRHYFPDLPDNPSTMAWLQDPTEEDSESSPYAPSQTRFAPSDIRFGFTGRLIAPNESREIPVSKGMHHHGQAPESAGYTIPELSILARSVLPNQRCIAYQMLGRILYRLGRGDFGQRGTELQEGLWGCIEKERPIEIMMSEANRAGGHVSAKAYATEALWLWRKGGGGDRGLLKPNERVAK